jgi:hypothetical protein
MGYRGWPHESRRKKFWREIVSACETGSRQIVPAARARLDLARDRLGGRDGAAPDRSAAGWRAASGRA